MREQEKNETFRPVKDAHRALGLWSIRRALTFAFTTALVLLVGSWFLLLWLLGNPGQAKPKPLETKDLLELVKLVFALVGGMGALVALVTAYRRQRVDEAAGERAERIQAHAEYDATERRVTEIYGQAVEHLGHDKAAVRLGGLYSLERLAQDHPQHRQTVVNLICAYLRMPFQLLSTDLGREVDGPQRNHTSADNNEEELQVRLAAQRLLRHHLTVLEDQPPSPAYWGEMSIDLTGALLVDFDFTRCHPGHAVFKNARFVGSASFGEATFSGDAVFDGATFSGVASFAGATFRGDAWFNGAAFCEYVWFDRVTFSKHVVFEDATLNGGVGFDQTTFSKDALFGGATFSGLIRFVGVSFDETAWFEEATFNGNVSFSESKFLGVAVFNGTAFVRSPDFNEAVASLPSSKHVWPPPWTTQTTSSDSNTASLIVAATEGS